MVSKTDSFVNWLNLGYELFSEEGHEGLQVERLSRILGKNKSGFYHYFGNRETFLKRLMQMHFANEEALIPRLIKLGGVDQRFLNLLVENKQTILFQTQLVKNRDIALFQETYLSVNELIEDAVRPVWVSYLGVSEVLAMKYWRLIRDTFYARVTAATFNQDWLSDFVNEAKSILSDAQNDMASN
jgi:AcrR family transcriptional regulator